MSINSLNNRRTCLKMMISLMLIYMTFGIFLTSANCQCFQSRVFAKTYIIAECGGQNTQSIIGVDIPVYGNNGSLYFTSPLSENTMVTPTEDQILNSMLIYPNPAIEQITIEWQSNNSAQAHILSQVGQIVSTIAIEANTINAVDIHELPPGCYFLKITDSQNKSLITKLIKQ